MKISSLRHLRRKDRLAMLVKEAGGASALAVRVGTPKSHISAMQAGNRGVGDDLAAKLEAKMDKPVGWMDADLLDYPDDSEAGRRLIELGAALAEIRELDEQRFEQLAANIDALLASIRKAHEILRAEEETGPSEVAKGQRVFISHGLKAPGDLDISVDMSETLMQGSWSKRTTIPEDPSTDPRDSLVPPPAPAQRRRRSK